MTKIPNDNKLRFIFLSLLVLLFALTNCGGPVSDEIPITTSSAEALEHFKLGRDLSERFRIPEALRHFQRAVKADPEFALAYLYLASVNPSPKGFFENLELASEHSSGISKGELLLIEATKAGVNGDPARQLVICKELVALYPKDVRTRMLLANQYFSVQDYDIAVSEYKAVVELDVAYAPPYNMLGYSLRALGRYEGAAEAFKNYIELIPEDPNPYDSYAELFTRMGKFDEAIDYYRKALKADRTFGASRLGIASNLVFMNRHDEAREELDKYFDEAINSGQQCAALLAAAITYIDEGVYDKALVLLHQRYELSTENSDAAAMAGDLRNIAFVQLLEHQPVAAQKSFNKSLEIIEASDLFERVKRNARQNDIASRSLVELERGNLSEAMNLAKEYLAIIEPSGNILRIRAAHLILGRVALAQGEYDTAIVHLEKANQETAWSQFHLAAAYEWKGNTVRAVELYESAATTYELNNLTYAVIRQESERRAKTLRQ